MSIGAMDHTDQLNLMLDGRPRPPARVAPLVLHGVPTGYTAPELHRPLSKGAF
jgi:hypothetical protein